MREQGTRARARGVGSVHMSTGFEIGILNSRHFCFDVSRPVIRSAGVYQRARARREEVIFFILTNSLLRFIGFRPGYPPVRNQARVARQSKTVAACPRACAANFVVTLAFVCKKMITRDNTEFDLHLKKNKN